jgi:hypothetical protein
MSYVIDVVLVDGGGTVTMSFTVNSPVNHITTSTDPTEEIRQLIDGQPHHLK